MTTTAVVNRNAGTASPETVSAGVRAAAGTPVPPLTARGRPGTGSG
ncbi:hypothetical protein ABZ464_37580 [Streptomyces sp. NPDC005820]